MAPRRPRTRGDCLNGPRPCPFVGCRHHLLLHVDGRDGALYVSHKRSTAGQRKRIDGSTPEAGALVEAWIEAAVMKLEQLEETCALDVADRGEATVEQIGGWLGTTKQFISTVEAAAVAAIAADPEKREAFASYFAQLERVELPVPAVRARVTVPVQHSEDLSSVGSLHQQTDRPEARPLRWGLMARRRARKTTTQQPPATTQTAPKEPSMFTIKNLDLHTERQKHVAQLIVGHDEQETLRAELSVRIGKWAAGSSDRDGIWNAWNVSDLHHTALWDVGIHCESREAIAAQLRGAGRMRDCDEAIAEHVGAESASPCHVRAAAKALYGKVLERPRRPGEGTMTQRRVPGTGLPFGLAHYLRAWERQVPSQQEAAEALAAMKAEPPLTAEQRAEVVVSFRAAEKAEREAAARREAAAIELGRMRRDLRAIIAAASSALEDSDPADVTRAWLACRDAMVEALADAGVTVELPELETEEAAAAAS